MYLQQYNQMSGDYGYMPPQQQQPQTPSYYPYYQMNQLQGQRFGDFGPGSFGGQQQYQMPAMRGGAGNAVSARLQRSPGITLGKPRQSGGGYRPPMQGQQRFGDFGPGSFGNQYQMPQRQAVQFPGGRFPAMF